LDTAHKLSENVVVLKSDNVLLKSQINKLHEKVGQYQGPLSSPRVDLQADKEIADPSKAAPRRNPERICAAVSVSASAHTAPPSKEFTYRGFTLDAASVAPSPKVSTVEKDSDGFNHGVRAVTTVERRRQLLVGVWSSASLPVGLKKERFRALFVSRFSPEVTVDDVEKSLKEQFRLKCWSTQNYRVFCTFPSSGVLETRKHDVSLTGSVSVLR
jgi:hypothetical protein